MRQEKMKQLSLKKVSLVAVLAMISLMPALAQDQQSAERPERPRHEVRGDKFVGQQEKKQLSAQEIALHKAKKCQQQLKLDDKQFNKVFKLFKKELEKMEAAAGKEGADKAQLKKDMKQRIQKKMQGILSEVQFAEWQQMDQRSRQCQHKGKGHGAGGRHKQGAPHGGKAQGGCPGQGRCPASGAQTETAEQI